jgi:hypothetical protein
MHREALRHFNRILGIVIRALVSAALALLITQGYFYFIDSWFFKIPMSSSEIGPHVVSFHAAFAFERVLTHWSWRAKLPGMILLSLFCGAACVYGPYYYKRIELANFDPVGAIRQVIDHTTRDHVFISIHMGLVSLCTVVSRALVPKLFYRLLLGLLLSDLVIYPLPANRSLFLLFGSLAITAELGERVAIKAVDLLDKRFVKAE